VASDDATYAVGRIRDRDVAGIGCMPASAGDRPATWMTEVRVDDVEAAADRVAAAGGTVIERVVDFGEIGRLSVLADPTGAAFCAWEAGHREGAQVINEPGAWSMSALHATDVDAAVAFYGSVFGWEPEAFGPVMVMRLPGNVGGEPSQPVPRDVVAVIIPAEPGAEQRWAVDFWVHDAEAAVADAERLGGHVVAPAYDLPGFKQAVLADPEGATFTVSQLLAQPV
jgi:predicted enzyme related to lactoylglutathione lyase